jgi:hypothetical protein
VSCHRKPKFADRLNADPPSLTWPGGLTVEFLGVYRAFIAGDASLAQVLKIKAASAAAK